jgi:glycosyltransferase involved in cell wall biosynthesis
MKSSSAQSRVRASTTTHKFSTRSPLKQRPVNTPTPAITVSIPVYNRAHYIATAIESVLSQDHTDFELLIIDDGSTDHSIDVVQGYQDQRIRLVRNDRNRGIPFTRNRALELARGRYIALMDSDDRMAPKRLSRQHRFLERHPNVALLGGWLRRFDDSGRLLGIQTKPLVHEQLRATLLFRTSHANTTVMGRTAILRKYGYRTEFVVGEDHDLFERLCRDHRVANIPRILSYQREHPGRITKAPGDQLLLYKYQLIDRQLQALGITASQHDLARHYRLTRITRNDWVADPHYLQWAADWLLGLLESNRATGVYSSRALEGVVAQTWIETCLRGARHSGLKQMLSRSGHVPWFVAAGRCAADNLLAAAGIGR